MPSAFIHFNYVYLGIYISTQCTKFDYLYVHFSQHFNCILVLQVVIIFKFLSCFYKLFRKRKSLIESELLLGVFDYSDVSSVNENADDTVNECFDGSEDDFSGGLFPQ